MSIFQLGAVTIESPGPFNATDTTEDFGSDFGVKPLVGARQDREFDGPADDHYTITGTLFPHRYEAWGKTSGLEAIDLLRTMTNTGAPQTLMRGMGVPLGDWYVEKVSQKSSHVGADGRGRVIVYDISLVRSARAPSAEDQNATLSLIMGSIVNLYG